MQFCHPRALRYPNIACELLTSDVNMINDSLAENPDLLNQLYAFLEIESPLNPLLASFFSKVMGLLITRKPDVFVSFLKERGEKTLVPQVTTWARAEYSLIS